MTIEFENRLVAFVDVLGWTNAIGSQSAETLFDVLLPLRQQGELYNEIFRQRAAAEFGDRVNQLMLRVQYAFFSDCFVFSMPVSMVGRIYSSVSKIIYEMLRNGHVLRGGITAGSLFHCDQTVFGPALVSAHQIESQRARFARVMVDESALRETSIHQDDALIQDHLGNWIVDPFPWVAESNDMLSLLQELYNPTEIIKVLETKIGELSGLPRQLDIWRFQSEVCAKSLEKFGAATADWVTAFRHISAVV